MISFSEAFELVGRNIRPLETEIVSLDQFLGRFAAENLVARSDVPAFDNSAVDGYAIHADDLLGSVLKVATEIRAGSAPSMPIRAGECARIYTGAPVPEGAAAMVMQEDVVLSPDGVRVPGATMGAHVRRRGEDVHAGETIACMGTFIDVAMVSALAAAGIPSGKVSRLPSVGILVTGDELVPPGSDLKIGQIHESNSVALAAAVRACGLEAPTLLRAVDEREAIRDAIALLLDRCEVVLTSGGVSVGDYDLVRPVLLELGVEEVFWQVAMKPAKPTYFGVHPQAVVFGLPGNPVSALAAFYLFVRPYIVAAQGGEFGLTHTSSVTTERITKLAGREEFVPGRMTQAGISPILGRASHKPTCLSLADGLIRVPRDVTCVEAGESVEVVPIHWGMRL